MSRSESGITRRSALRGGAAAVAALTGATGTVAAQGQPFDGWLSDTSNFAGVVDRTGEDTVTVIVGAQGNGGNLAFGPAAIRVDPGTTVVWEWNGKGGAHNVHATAGAGFNSGAPVADAGTTFEHTFEEKGVVKYQCDPHAPVGMKGVVVVGDVEVQTGGGGGESGGGGFTVPGGEFGGLFFGMLYVGLGLAAVMALVPDAYDLVRRRRAAAERAASAERVEGVDHAVEAPEDEPVRELGHDEYDPIGTASIVAAYFLILVLMWVFMYFVEFLGGGPTVIG